MLQGKSDIVIVCYSRTGHSRRLAERLARETSAQVIEIAAPAYPATAIGFLRAAFHSLRQRKLPLPAACKDLSAYDHLILCGPVWTSYPSLPLRSVLRSGDQLPSRVSLFLTSADTRLQEKAFAVAEADLGRKLHARASLGNGDENSDAEARALSDFITRIRNGGEAEGAVKGVDAALAAPT